MKKELLVSIMAAGLLTITGCSSNSNGDSNKKETSDTTGIQEQGKEALAALNVKPPIGGAQKAPNRAIVRQASSLLKAPQNTSCPLGGSFTFDSDTGEVDYDQCMYDSKDGNFTFNGTLHNEVGVITTTFSNHSYSLTYTTDDTMRYITFNVITIAPDAALTFSNFRIGFSKDIYEVATCTIDNSGKETCSDSKYEDPRDESLDGNLTMNIASSCLKGSYIFTTEKVMHILPDSGEFIESGRLDVNGIKIDYNSDKTLTLTYKDGSTDVVAQDTPVICK